MYFIHSDNSNFLISLFPLLTSFFFYVTELGWTKKFSCRKPLPVLIVFLVFCPILDTHEYFHWKKNYYGEIQHLKILVHRFTKLYDCLWDLTLPWSLDAWKCSSNSVKIFTVHVVYLDLCFMLWVSRLFSQEPN